MNSKEFRETGYKLVDWISDYYENIESYPVKSKAQPGDILSALPDTPPLTSENADQVMQDFEKIILPGITHWQSPNFFAYFPANSSLPSVLAEFLTAALGVQGMVWETSPAAAELEEKMMEWLKQMTGLPAHFHGVIQDTASTSTLVAVLSAREKASNYEVNARSFNKEKFTLYCSSEAHSSIEKAIKIAGFGKNSLRKIEVDDNLSMRTDRLEEAIATDLEKGFQPLCIISALGTTGTVAIDPLEEISRICKKYSLWHHVDAAYAGSAMVLRENRHFLKGVEQADSYVFNPHKWLFTNFDCSAYFVKDKENLIHTFSIMPEYLKTDSDSQVNNYRDWGIQLGRRFRALKLWFVIRIMGIEEIKEKIKNHIAWAEELAEEMRKHKHFDVHEPQQMGLVCFRLKLPAINNLEERNRINKTLLNDVNQSRKAYISHTMVKGEFTLRFVVANSRVTRDHVLAGWELIQERAKKYIHHE